MNPMFVSVVVEKYDDYMLGDKTLVLVDPSWRYAYLSSVSQVAISYMFFVFLCKRYMRF